MRRSTSQNPFSIWFAKLVLPLFFGLTLPDGLEAQEEKVPAPQAGAAPIKKTKFDDINEYVAIVQKGFVRSVEQADSQRRTALGELTSNYLLQLERIQRFFNDSGNAKAALRTRDAIKRIQAGDANPHPQGDEPFDQLRESRERYDEAKRIIEDSYRSKIAQLVEIGNEALEKRASELTRQGDLDRVEALTSLLPVWTGRPDLAKMAEQKNDIADDPDDEDFMEGKRINYPHETKPDTTVSMVFNGKGKATYIGLGGIEKPWSYRKGTDANQYHFWMTGRPQTPDWVYTFEIHPEGRSGTLSKGGTYRVEARIRR